MAGRSRVNWDDGAIAQRLLQFPAKSHTALSATIRYQAPRIEGVLKQKAPWQDRTSNARNGLFTKPDIEKGKHYAIDLAHTVSYGIWLEVKWSGRYAVIRPNLRPQGDLVMKQVATLFKRVFG